MIAYVLPGNIAYQQRLYPDPKLLDPGLDLKTYEDVIRCFTAASLMQDGIRIRDGSLSVVEGSSGYKISFDPDPPQIGAAGQFAAMHQRMLDEKHFGLALKGADACQNTPAWNPMAGYPVGYKSGDSIWTPCLPLGMPIVNHRAVTLLHYPPLVALRAADYLHNNTLIRWRRLLKRIGVPDINLYHAILDVNPIAAPGSGESEYANDFFPINLTSLFFDNDAEGLDYVRSMLELTLDPPANAASPQTLPLLVCGSGLYDPQAPGWFRTRYKDQLPKDFPHRLADRRRASGGPDQNSAGQREADTLYDRKPHDRGERHGPLDRRRRRAPRHTDLRGAGSGGCDLSQALRRHLRTGTNGRSAGGEKDRLLAMARRRGSERSLQPFGRSANGHQRAGAHGSVDRRVQRLSADPDLRECRGPLQAACGGKNEVAGCGLHADVGRLTPTDAGWRFFRELCSRSEEASRGVPPCWRTP